MVGRVPIQTNRAIVGSIRQQHVDTFLLDGSMGSVDLAVYTAFGTRNSSMILYPRPDSVTIDYDDHVDVANGLQRLSGLLILHLLICFTDLCSSVDIVGKEPAKVKCLTEVVVWNL